MEELALHLLDVMRNSIEAGAKRLVLTMTEDEPGRWLEVELVDDGRGMDAATLEAAFDPFFTSRTTRRVGLGLPLLRAAAEATGGNATLSSALGRGTSLRARFDQAHIDSPPLGDLAGTLATVVCGHPELDLEYSHHRGRRSFQFSSDQLRRHLGEVSPGQPAVFVWLRQYLDQQLKELRGGAGR